MPKSQQKKIQQSSREYFGAYRSCLESLGLRETLYFATRSAKACALNNLFLSTMLLRVFGDSAVIFNEARPLIWDKLSQAPYDPHAHAHNLDICVTQRSLERIALSICYFRSYASRNQALNSPKP